MPPKLKRKSAELPKFQAAKLVKKPITAEEITQSRAQAIVEAFEEFIKAHDSELRQLAINYAFLAGHSYEDIFNAANSVTEDHVVTKSPVNPTLCFDKIGDVFANILGTFPEAIPKVGVVKRLDSPVNDSVSRTQQQIIDYHIETQWDLSGNLAKELMPNLYPGGLCHVKVVPKFIGTVKTVADRKGNIVPDAVVNDDGSIRLSGKTIPKEMTKGKKEKLSDQSVNKIENTVKPEALAKMGYIISEVPEFIVDFDYVPVFDVAIIGRKKTPQSCIKYIHMETITISDLIAQFSGKEFDKQLEIIRSVADNMPEKQSEAPKSTTDEYLSRVGLCTEIEKNLYGDDRMVCLWTEWHNPSSEFPKGCFKMVISATGDQPTMLWESAELPKNVDYIPWGTFILDGNPAQSALKKSPMAAMLAPQIGRDRILNARLAIETRNVNPPDRFIDGLEFSIDGKEYQKLYDFPEDKTVYFQLSEEAAASVKKGIPLNIPYQYPQQGTVDGFLNILDEQFRNASHQRSMGTGVLPKNISGASVENQFAIDKMDLTPQLQMMQQVYFDIIKIACQMMKSTYHPGQRFRLSGGDDLLQDAVWVQEHVGDELDLILKSQIGQPLTKQAKLQEIQTKIGLMQSAQEAGADMGELLEAVNMREFAYSMNRPDPQYSFAKLRVLYLTKGLQPPAIDDKSNIPLHVAVIQAEIDSERFPKYDKKIQENMQKEIVVLSLMSKQKEAIQMAVSQPQPPAEQPQNQSTPIPTPDIPGNQ